MNKLIETIKTIILEYGYIKEHISKKTKERMLQKKLNNIRFNAKVDFRAPSPITRELYKKHFNIK